MNKGIKAKELLSNAEAAAYLGIKPQTLALWRSTGSQRIPFTRVGRVIRYRQSDLEHWLEQHREGYDDAE